MKMLRVLARGDIMVMDANYSAQTGRRRYVGRTELASWDASSLPEDAPRLIADNSFLSPGDGPLPHFAYPKGDSPVLVPNDAAFGAYFRKAVKSGTLWAADEATAHVCGVEFDPTFGGEYPALKE